MKLKRFWALFRYPCCIALHVLCAFDPRLADYSRLRGLDCPARADVNGPYMQKYPTDFCASYKPLGFIWQTDCWCKLPSPTHTESLEHAWCLTGYSSDWGGFRAERQNFSPIPNFFETRPFWIYCICSFNKSLADIALGVYFPAVILYHKYLRHEL